MEAAPLVVALLAPMPADLVDRLKAAGHEVAGSDPADPGLWQRAQVAATRGSLPAGDEVFQRLPNLRLLCCWGSGYDGVDLAAAARRGIAVCNSPGGNAASVADLATGFIISLLRAIPVAESHLRAGHWQQAAKRLPAPRGLTGARLGIFGYGEVGRRLAVRAQALEMNVGCCSRRAPAEAGVQHFADLLSLAQWADVLAVCVRADGSTHHAVDGDVLAALGPEGHLVNVARGSVVDEAALCRALAAGQLAGYASDVFEQEPQVPQALREFPNAVLTPHIGGASASAQQAMSEILLANIEHFMATGAPRFPVV
jgi:hydroxypyruvate reductase